MAQFEPRIDLEQHPLPPATRPRTIRPKNDPATDLRPALYQMAGVDLTQIDGLNILSIQAILSEIGTDMSKWKTAEGVTKVARRQRGQAP
jgi:hypothetical protein